MENHQPSTHSSSPTMSNYTTNFEFEWKFDYVKSTTWMQHNWHTSFYWVAAYLIFLYVGTSLMQHRPRFGLKSALFSWSLGLAIFSILGSYRMIPEHLYMLRQPNGFHASVCTPLRDHNPVWSFWAFAFILSKAPELGDTVFIVLRKQPLIFLHWYHHVTVLIYSWLTYAEYSAPSRWYIVMNFTIHSLMYSYYALRALGYRLPKFISMIITSSQILQMLVGLIVNIHAYQAKSNGLACDVSFLNINLGFLMYFSYFILFAKFFYDAYFVKSSKTNNNVAAGRKSKISSSGAENDLNSKANNNNNNNNNSKKTA